MPRAIDLVCDILVDSGIDKVFQVPGGYTQFLIDGIRKKKGIEAITARHEGSASAMADIYGRITGKPGVLMGQGPWIGSNGTFGIIEAYEAGSPMVIITDVSDWDNMNQQGTYQCGTGDYGTVNLPNVFRSMTKYMTLATTPREVVYGVQLAIKHAVSGRPAPTCVLCRKNALGGNLDDLSELDPPIYPIKGLLNVKPPTISDADAKEVANMLINAENPVLACGRGIHVSKAHEEVKEIAELLGMPVATSYMGKSSIPETHDLALGVMGGRGQPLATKMIGNADVILAIGTCLAPENTNNCSKDFIDTETQNIIQIDIESRNIGWTYPVELGAVSDAKIALRKVIEEIKNQKPEIDVEGRIEKLNTLKDDPENKFFTNEYYNSDEEPIEPERIVKELNDVIGEDDLIVLDSGNNRIWFCSLFKSKKARQIIAPGGAAGVAWGANASIAAQLLYPERKVISTVGDGGMLMALYGMETLKAYDIPLMYVVFNNSSLGNVRDFFSRRSRKLAEYPDTNFAKIAEAIGIKGIRVEKIEELRPALEKGLNFDGPIVIDVVTNRASHLRVRSSL
ncbi:MAG: thiamine pyrophosphate-binding protein [Promethearchaeia archaeon]